MSTERKPRPVRMDDFEWDAFRRLLGTVWLRDQVAKAVKKELRNTDK